MKKIKALAIVFFITLLLFSACNRGGAVQTGAARDTVTMASPTDIESMDPQFANNLVSMRLVTQIFDTLTRTSPTGENRLWLAESYEVINDGLSYVFTLRRGVRFHNGDELKASDVAFTVQRGMSSPFAGAIFGAVSGAEALNDYQVRIDLKFAYAPFLFAMSTPLSSIVSERAVMEAGDEFFRRPVGTGAYRFVSWEPGNRVILEAFDDWHGGKVPIKNLVFRVLPDPTTSVIALERGEVDMLLETPMTERAQILKNPNLRLYDVASHRFYYLGFNTMSPHFSDRRVREAVARTIDREGMRIVASEGTGFLAQNHLAPTLFGFAPSVTWYERDIEAARRLMQEAGKTGMNVRLIAMDGPAARAAQVTQDNLKEIGITANIEILERAALIEAGQRGTFDLMVHAWSTPVPDADYTVNFLFRSSMIRAMNNSFYNSPKIDALILQGAMQRDPNDRIETYRQITELLKYDLPSIPIYFEMVSLAAHKDLRGVVASPSSTYYFYELSW